MSKILTQEWTVIQMADELIRLDTTIIGIDSLINKASTAEEAKVLFTAKDVIYSQQRYFTDIQPVKRGHWKDIMMSEATGWDLSLTGGRDAVLETVCSVCGDCCAFGGDGEDYLSPYCPNCGARMDGEQNA